MRQLSEGGHGKRMLKQKIKESKHGHINISEILNNKNSQGILLPGQAINSNFDRMYTDFHSQNSQDVMSQYSCVFDESYNNAASEMPGLNEELPPGVSAAMKGSQLDPNQPQATETTTLDAQKQNQSQVELA